MDSVFKALADASRRDLLDALRQEDGQTLSQLEAASPLTRFGVAKHLGVLEAAGLVTRVKRGRFTHHYLNAVPLAEALGRWIEPYSVAPAVRGVLDLKARLEGDMDTKPDFVMSTFIRCTQDALWAALTDADEMGRWHFLASKVRREGDAYEFDFASGERMLTCRTLEADPKTRLVTTFELHGEGDGAPSRVIYLIKPEGTHCQLTLEHYELTFPVIPGQGIADGWSRWAAGLKTWLETGEATHFTEDALA
ncbi:MAG: SRPBCC domain-containing protein [Pseudomonadota bacterium]